jgi:hypothetical protein
VNAARFRFSASKQNSLISGDGNDTRVSTLYADSRIKSLGLSSRIGRQMGSSGGVLGRFDGAMLSYQIAENARVNVIGGSPVERTKDTPFSNHRVFYGIGADYSFWGKTLETNTYLFEQRAEGIIDRQSIGGDVRYVKNATALYGAVDFDTHFGQLNSSVFTANKMFGDQSSASLNLDYRRAPTLLASNALQGQGVYTLKELMQRYSVSEIDQLAFDRTAQSYTVTTSYSRPLNAKLQWTADLTANYLSGMRASGGVDAVTSTGAAYYLGTQLIGTDVFFDKDSVTGGLRYANTLTSDRYMLELGMSYTFVRDLRLNPTLRFGYADYKGDSPRSEYQFIPSLRASYALNKQTMLDFELGGKLTLGQSDLGKELQNEMLFLAGIRYDFSSSK